MLERWSSVSTQGVLVIVALAVFLFLLLRYRRALLGSLRNQLLLALSSVAAISLIVIVSTFLWQIRVILTDQTGEGLLTLAKSQSQRVSEQLVAEITLLRHLAEDRTLFQHIINNSDIKLATLSLEERTARLQASDDAWVNQTDQALHNAVLDNLSSVELGIFNRDFPAHTQLTLCDAYGRLLATGGDAPAHYYYGEETWWREAWNEGYGGIYAGSPNLTPGQQMTTIELAVPVYSPTDESEDMRTAEKVAVGVLRSQFAIHNLRTFAGDLSIGETGKTSLVDYTGLVLHSSDPVQIGAQLTKDVQVNIADNPFNWSVEPDETGQDIIHGHSTLIAPPEEPYLEALDWVIVVQQTKAEALTTVGRFSQIALLSSLLALTLAIATGSWIARRITRPIQELTQTASEMASGQLEHTASISGPTELCTLAEAFNSMTAQLGKLIGSLEQRVAERTHALERRSAYLEATAEVGRAATSILETDRLIQEAVKLIQERFGLYHVALALLDETGRWAEYRAGSGTAGKLVREQGLRLEVGGRSMIGWCTANAQARVTSDVSKEPWHVDHPLLPKTRSEAAIPLIARGQVIGALNIHSDQPDAFDQDTLTMLQTMADQIAVALNNADLFAQAQAALESTSRAYSELSREAWTRLLRTRTDWGYRYAHRSILPAKGDWQPEMLQAAQTGQSVQVDDNKESILAMPIEVRNNVVGVFRFHKDGQDEKWTAEETALLETLIGQLALALDGARLHQDTRRRAARERLIGEITDQMQRATDIESLLRITAEELNRTLDTSRTFVRLGTKAELSGGSKEDEKQLSRN